MGLPVLAIDLIQRQMHMTRRTGRPNNQKLIDARLRLQSPSGNGQPMSTQELAEAINAYLYFHRDKMETSVDHRYVSSYEGGGHHWPAEHYREAFRAVLGVASDAELGFYPHRQRRPPVRTPPTAVAGTAVELASTPADGNGDGTPAAIEVHFGRDQPPDLREVELVRRDLVEALCEGAIAEASLDDWDLTVLRHGRATRDRPAGVLLEDLRTDLAELKRALHRHRSASALRRLTRTAAQMSGLMCLTLCKLDQRSASRRWAHAARLAANEAGDPETQSWILAQEAYGHFYSTDLAEAIDVAQHAQAVTAANPRVGAALAAALEARAYAAMGRNQETRSALGRAKSALSRLEGDALGASAFGYNEAQFRFHEGNAYTHLGDVRLALTAQERALKLCAPGDYTDWAMTRLDRTRCLTKAGDTADALNYATETLLALSDEQRWGIITLRGHEILHSLPNDQQASAAAQNFRELLMLTTERKEVTGP